MKSPKRGPAPPVVRGPLATLRGLRLTFCSRRRSTCSPLQQLGVPPDPSSAPLSRRGLRPRPPLRHAHPCTSSVFNYRALPFPTPTMIYWKDGPEA